MVEGAKQEYAERVLDYLVLPYEVEDNLFVEWLKLFTKEDLITIVNRCGLSFEDNDCQSVIIKEYFDYVSKNSYGLLKHQSKKNIELLNELLKGKKSIYIDSYTKENPDVVELLTLGLVFLFKDQSGRYNLVLPKDTGRILQSVLNDLSFILKSKQTNFLRDTMNVYLHLYGAVETVYFLEKWNEQNKEYIFPFTMEGLCVELEALQRSNIHFGLGAQGKVIHNYLTTKATEGIDLIRSTKECDYYKPTGEDMDYFAVHEFDMRTSAYREMKRFIEKQTDDITVKFIMDMFMTDITCGSNIFIEDIIHDLFEYYEIELLTGRMQKEFTQLYINLNNQTPKWILRGHSLDGLARNEDAKINIHQNHYVRSFPNHNKNIGISMIDINAPCPCGSTIAFRECHGLQEKN